MALTLYLAAYWEGGDIRVNCIFLIVMEHVGKNQRCR